MLAIAHLPFIFLTIICKLLPLKTMNVEHELHRFADAFKSEDELRQHLAVLLRKIPHNQGVQITHGAQEYGKDIIFYAPDGFDNWHLNACVVKKTKINGSVDDNDGVRTVLYQAEQALDTPLLNSSTGQEERVSKVFIVSPFDCPQSTIHSIQGKLTAHFGRIEFLCGSKLFDKFSKYWPEFVLFESTLLGAYVAALQQSIDESDPISFLISQHHIFSSANKSIRNVYVRQRFTISLQQFELLVEPPNFNLPDRDITARDIEEICEQLGFLVNLIQHAQVWEFPNPAKLSSLIDSLASLSNDLKKSWKQMEQQQRKHEDAERELLWLDRDRPKNPDLNARLHIQARRETLQDESKAAANEAQILTDQIAQTLANLAHWAQPASLSEAITILNAFRLRVLQANDFVRATSQSPVNLHSQEYLNFIRISEVVRVAPAAFRKSSPATHLHFPESLLDEISGPMLITAPAGYGKTSFCKWNALNDVQCLADKTADILPVYVPLHQLATSKVSTCEAAFFRTSEVVQLVTRAQQSGQKVRVYLDGLDEVTTTEQQERLISLAEGLPRKYPSIQIIVTARDHVSGPWLRWLSRIHLSELDEKQVGQLVVNWLGDDPRQQADFKKQLSRVRTLQPLMHVPLLGTLTIAVFRKMKSLPESKVKLYETFVDLMCGGWDLAKNVRRETRFGSQDKLGVLTRLAGLLHGSHKREAQESDIRTAVSQTMPNFLEQWRTLLDELLEDGLLIRIGSNSLAFSHLSFQEYLAATEMTDPNGTRQQQTLKLYLSGEDWWKEVLAFYIAMCKRPDEIEVWIRRVVAETSNNTTFFDLKQRFGFLMDALENTWLGWKRKEQPLQLAKSYLDSTSQKKDEA